MSMTKVQSQKLRFPGWAMPWTALGHLGSTWASIAQLEEATKRKTRQRLQQGFQSLFIFVPSLNSRATCGRTELYQFGATSALLY